MNPLLLYLLFHLATPTLAQEKATLTIRVDHIKSVKGTLKLGLFNTAKTFPINGRAYLTISKKVHGNHENIILKDLPTGFYAAAIYQDLNSDEKCNTNLLGFPVEPFGFSQNYRPVFRAPQFDDCKINLQRDTVITVSLID